MKWMCQRLLQLFKGFFWSLVIILLLSNLFVSCVETYEPVPGTNDQILVVDGLVTDLYQPVKISLSYSFSLDEEEGQPVESAEIVIEDDLGNSVRLNEVEPGVYSTDPVPFEGEAGRLYRIIIKTADGNSFASDFEQLKRPPEIAEVYYKVEEVIPGDPSLNPIRGLQFYLDTEESSDEVSYFLWEFEETFQYGNQFPARITVDFGAGPGGNDDEIIPVPFDEFEGLNCYKTLPSQRIIIGTTEGLSHNRIEGMPVHFVDDTTPKLYIKYSFLVKQYAISKEFYNYLEILSETNQSTGSLFDPIPNEVFGNVKSTDGKNIPVLGYFGVGGVSTSRIFVTREDLPLGFSAPIGPSCLNDTLPLNFNRLYERLKPGNMVLYDYHRNLFGFILGYLLTEPECSVCSANEATNQIPDFW